MWLWLSFILASAAVAVAAGPGRPWSVQFTPETLLQLPMEQTQTIVITSNDITNEEVGRIRDEAQVRVLTTRGGGQMGAVIVSDLKTQQLRSVGDENGPAWVASVNVTGYFPGYSDLTVWIPEGEGERESQPLKVTVVRQERAIDKAFTISVAILVSVIYINFGCAVDWLVMKSTIKRPIGPVIGLFAQFFVMPLVSFGLGRWLFPNSAALQLGLFFTGISPAGGASNIWTVFLGGNLNLSITMTTISTMLAFVMMPAWTFTLGRVIFEEGAMVIPYSRILTLALGLIVPLAVGLLLQRYLPRVAAFMSRLLKTFSIILIIFIIIFAIVTNLYLFQLFTWQIIVAGLGLPWIGYIFGMALSKIFRQVPEDCIAIAIEAGIQNTGIAIFMLRFSLGQPEADLTTVLPVSVAILTPIPLMVYFVFIKLRSRKRGNMAISNEQSHLDPVSKTNTLKTVP